MSELLVLDETLDKTKADADADKAVPDAVYTFTGTPEEITLLCDKEILNDVIDRFGTDVKLTEDSDRLRVSFSAPPGGCYVLGAAVFSHAELIKPKWLRSEIIDSIHNNYYMGGNYNDVEGNSK